MYDNNKKIAVDEVAFANHIYEFIRFYGKHKLLMDEITGIQERVVVEKGKERSFYITKSTFKFAIKRLKSFIIDNLHYIKDYSDTLQMEKDIEQIELDFTNDTIYQGYIKKSTLSTENQIAYATLYFKYIIRCFELANRMCNFLQSSLMIGTKDIKKYVSYYNNKEFFENLSKYRDEISNDVANFKLSSANSHVRKIMGYYYTYKILLSSKDVFTIDPLVFGLIDYILHPNTIKLIITIRTTGNWDTETQKKIDTDTFRINKAISKIYYIVNKDLSVRNILPKIQKRISIDRTLI
jgi:hypothetical protein